MAPMTKISEMNKMTKMAKRIQTMGTSVSHSSPKAVMAGDADPGNEDHHMTPANERHQVLKTATKGVLAVKEAPDNWELSSTPRTNRCWGPLFNSDNPKRLDSAHRRERSPHCSRHAGCLEPLFCSNEPQTLYSVNSYEGIKATKEDIREGDLY
ncbi:hypothetical protein HOY80DRAFT_1002093 [Tuber brumale]|nr:hypothetical protein HOY80DRAFT_1002093 [Tuber brumale]